MNVSPQGPCLKVQYPDSLAWCLEMGPLGHEVESWDGIKAFLRGGLTCDGSPALSGRPLPCAAPAGEVQKGHTHISQVTFFFFVHGPFRYSVIATGNGWILLWLNVKCLSLPTPQGSHI